MSIGLTAQTFIPYVEEAMTPINDAVPGPATTTMIVDVPCIHARRIDVVINSAAALGAVDLVFSCASGALTYVVNLGAVGAGVTVPLTYTATAGVATEAVGDFYAVRVTNAGAATTATIWTAARS